MCASSWHPPISHAIPLVCHRAPGWAPWLYSNFPLAICLTQGVGDGQGGLACCASWGRRVGHDWATELNVYISLLLSVPPTLSFPCCPQVWSLCLSLYSCPSNRLINTIFPNSIYMDSVSLVSQLCPTLCDPMDCSTPGFLPITNSWSLSKLMSIESVIGPTISSSVVPIYELIYNICFSLFDLLHSV